MKAEMDKDGVLWIRGETILEALFIKHVLSFNKDYEADKLGFNQTMPKEEETP